MKDLSFSYPLKAAAKQQTNLPESIQSVYIFFCEADPGYTLHFLPLSLTALYLQGPFNESIPPYSLPPTLQTLEFGTYFDKELCLVLYLIQSLRLSFSQVCFRRAFPQRIYQLSCVN